MSFSTFSKIEIQSLNDAQQHFEMVHLSICEFCACDFATLILISSTHTDFVCCLQILLDQTQRTPEPYLNELFVTANRIFLRLHRQILLLFVQIKAPSGPSFSLFTKIMVSVFDVTNSLSELQRGRGSDNSNHITRLGLGAQPITTRY